MRKIHRVRVCLICGMGERRAITIHERNKSLIGVLKIDYS